MTIESRVDVFHDAGGARKDLAAYGTLLRAAGVGAHVSHPPAGALGQRSATLLFDQGAGATALRTVAVAWQEANATASVTVQGFARGTTMGAVLRLARRQDRLLRAAER